MTSVKRRLHGGKRPSNDFAMTLADACTPAALPVEPKLAPSEKKEKDFAGWKGVGIAIVRSRFRVVDEAKLRGQQYRGFRMEN